MRCPLCLGADTRVVDSRAAEDGAAIRRRRACAECTHRFTTFERSEELVVLVRKRSGERVPFDRAKLISGMAAAAKGRPVAADAIVEVATAIEEALRAAPGEITTQRVGLAVLDALRGIDQIAYLRFASVYKGFDDPGDFLRELRLLEGAERAGTMLPGG
ncbi:MAG: transcriptional regulator NrdR [Acidimicrobiia bacterium]|nr:transcriptional regulator NrdR [Acidimicrobiia bacterium]